jgi:hypothetical protein
VKTKTIVKTLTAKHASWCKSISDARVRKIAEDNVIITGGAIVSMLLKEEPNDYDVYLKTPEAALAIAEYYVAELKKNPPAAFEAVKDNIKAIMEPAVPEGAESQRASGRVKGPQPPRVRIVVGKTERGVRGEEMVAAHDLQYAEGQVGDDTEPEASYEGNVEALDEESFDKVADKADSKGRGKYRVLFVTANAITLADGIQIVLRFNGDVDEIHQNYDYTHCTQAWTSWDKKLHLRIEAMECIMSKELRYQGSRYPIASMIRSRKFITRGWTINAGQYVKMAYQVAQLDLNDPMVLEDQLVGVDSAYFSQLIQQLKEQPDPTRVDGGYLLTLIDKIF